MNVRHRLVLRFLRMRRAYTGQSPATLCPGVCINVHHVRACSCRLSRRLPSHSSLAPVFANSGVSPKRASQNHGPREQLVAPAATTASPSAAASRESPSAATTGTSTAGFLACFINHERTTVDVQAVKFCDGPGRIITRAKFDEAESTRPARIPVSNNSGRDCLVAFFTEQLEQAFVGHTVREISYIEFCHMDSLSVLLGLTRHRKPSQPENAPQINYMTFRVCDEAVDGKSCASPAERLAAFLCSWLSAFACCFCCRLFFLALLKGDRHGKLIRRNEIARVC